MAEIASREELEEWLKDKPADWAQVIAVRAALRVLPIALNDKVVLQHKNNGVTLFRAAKLSWAALNLPNYNMTSANANAASAAYALANAAYAYDDYTFTAYAAIADATYATAFNIAAINSATSITSTTSTAYPADSDLTWLSVDKDVDYLESNKSNRVSRMITSEPLWISNKMPHGIQAQWFEAKDTLIALDKNYSIWIDWYERRLRGEEAAFDISYDDNHIEDAIILHRLSDSTDKNFWDKGAEYVNALLNEWLREARQRAQERYDAENSVSDDSDDSDTEIAIPPQNSNAITFQRGETGKIAVNQTASSDEILKDADSVERHQLTLEEALEISRKCETSNAGARLTQLLENYINSIGQSLEEIKPSMAVQRGEKLRQELAAYDRLDNMLAPISDEILLDLKGWQSAHNMMVGLQPKLNDLDTSMLGPDKQPELFPPDDLRKLASDADEAELLEDGTLDVLQETADLAPAIPDHNNRRTIWSVETSKNLIIEAFAIAINNLPAAGAITLGVGTAGFAATGTAVAAAYYLVKYRDWIETRLGNSPTWKSLFITLCDKLEKITPFEPKKPNP